MNWLSNPMAACNYTVASYKKLGLRLAGMTSTEKSQQAVE